MTNMTLPNDLNVRSAKRDDAQAITDINIQHELAETGTTESTVSDVFELWDSERMVLANDTCVITTQSGEFVALCRTRGQSNCWYHPLPYLSRRSSGFRMASCCAAFTTWAWHRATIAADRLQRILSTRDSSGRIACRCGKPDRFAPTVCQDRHEQTLPGG